MKTTILEHPRIRSERHFNDIANTPLWSCLLAGYAAAAVSRTGAEVDVVDAAGNGLSFSETIAEILRRPPDLLCVNAVYFWEYTPRLFSFLDRLRAEGYAGHVNLFGFFPTLAWTAVLQASGAVDSVAVGECEWTLAELARRTADGGDWRGTPGLAWREDGAVVRSRPRPPEPDPDRFPFPVRPNGGAEETAAVLASRGCYNQCRFCPIPPFYNGGPLWRGRSPESVAAEIARLLENGTREVYFVDPNFFGPGRKGKDRIQALCRKLSALKVPFGMETRADDLDPQTVEILVSGGLRQLLIGVESGSASVLGKLDKHADSRSAERAIRLCREAGIEPEIGFLMFVPDAGLEDLAENLAFLRANDLLGRLDRTANLLGHSQIVLAGTSGHRRFREQGRILSTDALGFVAEIAHRDPRVQWMSRVMGHACRFVLALTGDKDSPLYWRRQTDWQSLRPVNDALVELFEEHLAEARSSGPLPHASEAAAGCEAVLRRRIRG